VVSFDLRRLVASEELGWRRRLKVFFSVFVLLQGRVTEAFARFNAGFSGGALRKRALLPGRSSSCEQSRVG
jgi:hypothetical protein